MGILLGFEDWDDWIGFWALGFGARIKVGDFGLWALAQELGMGNWLMDLLNF